MRVFAPSGTEVAFDADSVTAAILGLDIVESGEHQVVVQDSGADNTGIYTVHFARVTGANEGGRLPNDARLAGTLDLGDLDTFTFDAQAGDRVHLNAGDTNSTSLFPVLVLFDPSGTQVASDADSVTATLRNIEITESGVWTAVLFDSGADNVGDYELFFARISGANEKGLLPNDARRAASLAIGDVDTWTFTADVGDRVHVSAADIDSTSLFPDLLLYAPDGTLAISDADSVTALVSGFTVTSAGVHTVVVRDSGADNAGDYELHFALAPGAAEGGTLAGNTVVSARIDLGDFDSFEFGGRTGGRVTLNVADIDNTSLFPVVSVYDEAGTRVGFDTDSVTARIDLTVPADGFYTVIVQDSGADNAGDYTLDFVYIGATPPVRTRGIVLEPNLWHLLGVPGNTGGTLGELFGSILDLADYDNPDAEDGWILFGYEPATDTAAARYVELGLSDPVPQGTGFWFLHLADTALRLNLPPAATDASGTMGGGCAPGATCITTPLAASPAGDWTIGAVPTTRSPGVDTFRVVTDVTAPECTDGCTLDEAADAGYTAPNGFWVYEQSTDNYRLLSGVDSVAPWTGFWLRTTEVGGAASPELLIPVQ